MRVNGKSCYLWRAVDHEGEVLEVLATKRRDRRAALKFPRRAMKRYGRPASIVTDRLRSYRVALPVIGNADAQTCGRWLNNRAENSHPAVPTTGRGTGQFQGCKDPAGIRRRPRLDPQPLQPPTPSQPPRYFQTSPNRRLGRVASTRSLRPFDCGSYKSCPVGLTMPSSVLPTRMLKVMRAKSSSRVADGAVKRARTISASAS